MQRNLVGLQVLQVILWAMSIALILCMAVIPFLSIDRNFNISFDISARPALQALQNPALGSALTNSVILSVLASLFAIACGSALTSILNTKSYWIILSIIAVYALNPVARALAYFDLFQTYTPIYSMSSVVFGAKFSSTILLPALILGIHYLPIYLMRSLFVVGRHDDHKVEYPPLLNVLFVQIPPWVKGFPISFALFFLLTFFDYWVIQVISGNTVLYWTPLFIQKALASRAINEAALMIDIGLVVTFAAYLVAVVGQFIIQSLWRYLRPISFMGKAVRVKGIHYGRKLFYAVIGFLVVWPWVNSLIRLVKFSFNPHAINFMPGYLRAISSMLFLGISVAAVSTVLGLLLSAVFQTNPKRYRWWLPSAYLLALVPEAAYVLLSLFATGSGLLHGNIWWLFFLMSSFSIPMAFFIWQSTWQEGDQVKLWLLGTTLKDTPQPGTKFALAEWKQTSSLIFLLLLWLTLDNVFITDFAAGPKWKPLSAAIFNATKRGFSDTEFFTSILSAAVVCICVFGVLFWNQRKPSS